MAGHALRAQLFGGVVYDSIEKCIETMKSAGARIASIDLDFGHGGTGGNTQAGSDAYPGAFQRFIHVALGESMNNEYLTNIFMMTFLLIFGFFCLILIIRSMKEINGGSHDKYHVSPVRATSAQTKPHLNTRQIQERERLRQLVRAHVQADRFRTGRRKSK
jgi:hypothetical protein